MDLKQIQEQCLVRIVDDDEVMRKSWNFLIEGEGWKTSCYAGAFRFLEEDDDSLPGCVILDVRMPNMSGIELQRIMGIQSNHLPIIFVSAHGDIDMAVQALKDGAFDFLPKLVSAERLLAAIEKACLISCELHESEQREKAARDNFNSLTQREKMVARKVALGLLNKQIADELDISEKTVQAHRGAVCRKLGVKSAVGVAAILRIIHEDAGDGEIAR